MTNSDKPTFLAVEEQSVYTATTERRPEMHISTADMAIADRTTICEVMRRSVECVSPDTNWESLAALFLERGISGAPVIDDDSRPIGVVSKTDLIRACFAKFKAGSNGSDGQTDAPVDATVRQIMMPVPFVLPQNERLSRAAALMAFESVHRVLVVAEDGKIAGIITALDIVRWLAKHAGFVVGD